MKNASTKLLGLSVAAGALIAAGSLGVQTGDAATHIQAAPSGPVQFSPDPPSPPPPPPPPAMTYDPNQDYWSGQGSGGGAPGAGGGG
jgi:hypothetical protein